MHSIQYHTIDSSSMVIFPIIIGLIFTIVPLLVVVIILVNLSKKKKLEEANMQRFRMEYLANMEARKNMESANQAAAPATVIENYSDPNASAISAQIREITKLRDDGIISEEEYNYKKSDLLSRL